MKFFKLCGPYRDICTSQGRQNRSDSLKVFFITTTLFYNKKKSVLSYKTGTNHQKYSWFQQSNTVVSRLQIQTTI